jgi:hypothetical protein
LLKHIDPAQAADSPRSCGVNVDMDTASSQSEYQKVFRNSFVLREPLAVYKECSRCMYRGERIAEDCRPYTNKIELAKVFPARVHPERYANLKHVATHSHTIIQYSTLDICSCIISPHCHYHPLFFLYPQSHSTLTPVQQVPPAASMPVQATNL